MYIVCISIPFSETRVCMHTSHDTTSFGCKKQPLKPETTRAIMTATHRRMRQRYVLVLVPVSLFLSLSLCPCSCPCRCPCPWPCPRPCPCPCPLVPVPIPIPALHALPDRLWWCDNVHLPVLWMSLWSFLPVGTNWRYYSTSNIENGHWGILWLICKWLSVTMVDCHPIQVGLPFQWCCPHPKKRRGMERKRRKGEQGEGRRKVERWMEQGERKKRRKEEKGGRERGGEEEPVTHKTMDD